MLLYMHVIYIEKYVKDGTKMLELLQRLKLKFNGKKSFSHYKQTYLRIKIFNFDANILFIVMLLCKSLCCCVWLHSNKGMKHLTLTDWVDLFDVVVVQARKPKFYFNTGQFEVLQCVDDPNDFTQ